jgi:hypothetical protein
MQGMGIFLLIFFRDAVSIAIINPAIKHINCHAGLDPASRPIMDSRFFGNDGFDIYSSL